MKINIKELIFLVILLLIGIFFFFHKLNIVPPGFYVDEALHGYAAYSILETGKDEYGKAFPIVFRLYGSYNAPLYIYLTTIPIKLWGLGVFSVRFVAALSGIGTVLVIYLFLKSLKISTLGSVFFAITPVVVFQGRIGYEVALAFFFFCLGSYFLWRSLKSRGWLISSFFVLSLSTYTAYAERFTVPFFLLFFFVAFRKKLLERKNIKYFIWAAVIFILTQIPHLIILSTPAFFPKAEETGFQNIIFQAGKLSGFIPAPLALALSFIREFLSQYINYFSPATLFLAEYKDLPGLPVFYQWMIIPYLIGLFVLFRDSLRDRRLFILILALTTPITASLTKDPFPVHRAMPVFLPLFLIIAVGMEKIIQFKFLKNKKFNTIFKSLLLVTVFLASLLYLWRSYFVFFPKEKAKYWSWGYSSLSEIIRANPDKQFVIDRARFPIPYSELAFFLKVPPSEFQASVDQNIRAHYYENLPFEPNFKFANIETRQIVWKKDIYLNQRLVGDNLSVSPEQAKEHFLEKLFEIKDPLGEIIFVGYETNPAQKCRSEKVKSPYCLPASTF